jgi:hypothetical protein
LGFIEKFLYILRKIPYNIKDEGVDKDEGEGEGEDALKS